MEVDMKGSSKTIRSMEEANSHMPMELLMMESFLQEFLMERESRSIKMDQAMKANFKMVKRKAGVS